jgi:hypothetical protein
MSFSRMLPKIIASLVLPFVLATGQYAHAATVNWVTWNSPETMGGGTPIGCTTPCPYTGVATGESSDVSVTYFGEEDSRWMLGDFKWLYTGTFSGGTVGDAPTSNTEVLFSGVSSSEVDTIIFSKPVNDPVLAIAELGAGPGRNGVSGNGPDTQTLNFIGNPSFAIEKGGPIENAQGNPDGKSITQKGESVYGIDADSNGVIQFFGQFTSISWTETGFKYYTIMTVGDEGLASADPPGTDPPAPAVPEPSTWALMLLGLAGLGFAGYRTSRKAVSAS